MKRTILATALISCALILVPAAANATDLCVVDTVHHDAIEEVSHQEYQYKKIIPGTQETFRTEYRFQTRTKTFGWVEHKFIYSRWDFVDGGQTTVNGKVVSGHWQSTGSQAFWHAIPDSVINAVWGSGGIPDNVLGGSQEHPAGSVPLTAYGAPRGAGSAQYYASKVQESTGYTDWGPWSDWSAANPGPSNDTRNVESRRTSNNDSTPDTTVYYVENGEPTTSLTDANWTTITPAPEGWTFEDKRSVVTTLGEDAYDEDVYGDCPAPELAETGVNDNAWLFAGGALLLIAMGASLVVYRKRPRGAHRA
jgi:LPXTG-motif cell wall-anchored protein